MGATTRTVTNLNDSGPGSLRDAIVTGGAGDTIEFGNLGGTIFLQSEIAISRNLTIVGTGSKNLEITRASGIGAFRIFTLVGGTISISGLHISNGFILGPDAAGGQGPGGDGDGGGIFVGPSTTVTLTDLEIENCQASGGTAGMSINSIGAVGGGGNGGGVCNRGTLTLINCSIHDNSGYGGNATDYGGGPGQGGGVFNGSNGFLTISNSAIYNNHVLGGNALQNAAYGGDGLGGGVCNNNPDVDDDQGFLVMTNCTVAHNDAGNGNGQLDGTGKGGGVFVTRRQTNVAGQVVAVITNCTITNNVAAGPGLSGGGGFGEAGGLDADGGAVNLLNTLIATNSLRTPGINSPDVLSGFGNGSIKSLGHNFVSRTDGSPPGTWTGTDDTGTIATPLDPLLNPAGLSNNGGPTLTQALLPNSSCIDAGDDSVLGQITTDQRGYPRKGGLHVDIGAYEFDPPQAGPVFTVTTTDEHSDGVCGQGDCSLWEAMNAANATNNTIVTFAPGVVGTITTKLQSTGINIIQPVTITGPGARLLTISAENLGRVLNVSSTDVVISGLTLTNGNTNSLQSNASGGGILNSGNLTLNSCALNNNNVVRSDTFGAGIENSGTLTLNNCTLVGNRASASSGGGIDNIGTATVTNCTFFVNEADSGGAIRNLGTITLTNSTFSGNYVTGATTGGGGLLIGGGATTTINNSLFAANSASSGGPNIQGTVNAGDYNLVQDTTGVTLAGTHNITGQDPLLTPAQNNGGDTDTFGLTNGSPAINAANNATAPPRDQRGYLRNGAPDIGAFEFNGTIPHTLGNISTRGFVQSGSDVMIVGFIITGGGNKLVVLRALGPTLTGFGVGGAMANPTIELHDGTGAIIAFNDNWQQASNANSIPVNLRPPNSLESAILASLPPGNYTAIVRGVNNGTGVALVEGYDLDDTAGSRFGNISTRGFVQTGTNVLIAGVIVQGPDSEEVVVRGLGPTLGQPPFNVPTVLPNPFLDLRDSNGNRIMANDNWADTQQSQIQATGLAPPNFFESAISATLAPANYTVILSGVANTTGNALVEVYARN